MSVSIQYQPWCSFRRNKEQKATEEKEKSLNPVSTLVFIPTGTSLFDGTLQKNCLNPVSTLVFIPTAEAEAEKIAQELESQSSINPGVHSDCFFSRAIWEEIYKSQSSINPGVHSDSTLFLACIYNRLCSVPL